MKQNGLVVLMIMGIGLYAAGTASAQSLFAPNPYISQPTGTVETRLSPKIVLDRAVEAWKTVRDCRLTLHIAERLGQGEVKEQWISAAIVHPVSPTYLNNDTFLLEFYKTPVGYFKNQANQPLIAGSSPEKIYYSNSPEFLYIYEPEINVVTVDNIDEDTPLPEFMKLIGVISVDPEELMERAYPEAEIYEENIDGIPCIRLRMRPRSSVKDVEPDRMVWFSVDTSLPVRLAVKSEVEVVIDLRGYEINRNIDPQSLEPVIPDDAHPVNLMQ